MSYLILKHLHVSCVVLSGLGFFLRGCLMLAESAHLHGRLARRLPHLIDTVLLTSAITMAVISGQYPFAQGWLTAKLCGLLIYIVLGSLALKRGRTRAVRVICFVLALLAFAYIVAVALTRQAGLGF